MSYSFHYHQLLDLSFKMEIGSRDYFLGRVARHIQQLFSSTWNKHSKFSYTELGCNYYELNNNSFNHFLKGD